jgi:Protein of unknown function (DUF3486)
MPRRILSKIDMLPPEAEEDVLWAYEELRAKKRLQEDILAEFNTRLKLRGIEPISRPAFSRASMRVMRMATRLDETREIASVLSEKLGKDAGEEVTLMVSETIKTLIFETIENAGRLKADGKTAEMLANFALALKNAEQSRVLTAQAKLKVMGEFAREAAKAIDRLAKDKGLSAETVGSIKSSVLGLKVKA